MTTVSQPDVVWQQSHPSAHGKEAGKVLRGFGALPLISVSRHLDMELLPTYPYNLQHSLRVALGPIQHPQTLAGTMPLNIVRGHIGQQLAIRTESWTHCRVIVRGKQGRLLGRAQTLFVNQRRVLQEIQLAGTRIVMPQTQHSWLQIPCCEYDTRAIWGELGLLLIIPFRSHLSLFHHPPTSLTCPITNSSAATGTL